MSWKCEICGKRPSVCAKSKSSSKWTGKAHSGMH